MKYEGEEDSRYLEISGKTYLLLILIFIVISISILRLYKGYSISKGACTYTQCQYNLNTIAQALKSYADKNGGRFPRKLTDLTPDHIREIPQCSGYMAKLKFLKFKRLKYEDTYKVSDDGRAFTFYCPGGEHDVVGVKENYPQYTSKKGLICHQNTLP